jgi:hypothetical protein
MQGLSILMMFTPDPKTLDPALNLLHEYKDYIADKLIAQAKAEHAAGGPDPIANDD